MVALHRSPLHRAVIAAALVSWLPGCSGHDSWSSQSLLHHKRAPDGTRKPLVIDAVSFEGRVAIVVAAAGASSKSISAPPPLGVLHTMDGRDLPWSCDTVDGRAGSITIDGRSFDLADGAVFLVDAEQRPAALTQIAADLSQLRPSDLPEDLARLDGKDPGLAAFLDDFLASK